MNKQSPYVVSKVKERPGVFYCHQRGYDYIPVFGSIGDKAKAKKVCKMMNESAGYKAR